MSAKSRKRNKRLLALAGLAGAVAMSNRKKKSDLASTEDGKGGIDTIAKAKQSMTSDKAYSPPKKNIPQTTKVNTERKKSMAETSTVPKKRPGITVYDDGSIKAPDKGSGNFVDYANKEKYSNRLDTKPPGASGSTKSTGTTARGSNTFNDKIRANNAALKDGGRAEYKSGGKVKGCGKALRGFGKAMKGNR
jgi:hypothetical protein